MKKVKVTVCHNYLDRKNQITKDLEWKDDLSVFGIASIIFPPSLEVACSVNGKVIEKNDYYLAPDDHVVFIPRMLGGNTLTDRLFNPFSSGHDPWEALKDSFGFANSGGSVFDQSMDAVRRHIQGIPGVGGLADWHEGWARNNWETVNLGLTVMGFLGVWNPAFGIGAQILRYAANRYGISPRGEAPSIPTLGAPSVAGYSGGGGGMGNGGGGGTGMEFSNSYSWGPQTLQTQGAVIPVIYGTFITKGNMISSAISSVVSGNNAGEQILNSLLLLCQGPIKNIGTVRINNKDIDTFTAVSLYYRYGDVNQPIITEFQDTYRPSQTPPSTKMEYNIPVDVTTTGDDFDGLRLTFSFPGGLFKISAASTELHYEDVYLDWQDSKGVWHHDYIGQKYLGSTTYGGDNVAVEVIFAIYYKKHTDTNYTLHGQFSINENRTTAFSRDYEIKNLPRAQYDIRVYRQTADSNDPAVTDDMYFSSVTEILMDDFQYPTMALVGIKALATSQLSGSLDFSCIVTGKIVRVYNGSSWVIQWTDNPAWVAYDILTQPVFSGYTGDYTYRAGSESVGTVSRYDGIDPADIDTTSFYAWAQFCDGLVPDGAGGYEKRFVFNGVFDTASSQWDAVLEVCKMSRAMIYIKGYKYYVTFDKIDTPVQMFTSGNIIADSFKETFLSLNNRASEIEVDFANEDYNYARQTITIVDPNAIRPKQVTTEQLIGCTKTSQAWRVGRYRLYCNQYIVRFIEFQADIDAIACEIGQLIYFAHDLPQWGFSGRVVSATSTSVTLDRTVSLTPGITYAIRIRLSDDTVVYKTTTGSGDVTSLSVSTFSVTPSQYDLYTFGLAGYEYKPFRVTKITPSSNLTFAIEAAEYNASIFNCDTDDPAYPTPNYSSLDPIPQVTNILLDEIVTKGKDGTLVNNIDVYWDLPGVLTYAYAEVWYKGAVTHGAFVMAGRSYTDRLRIANLPLSAGPELYTIAVRSANSLGQKLHVEDSPQATLTALGKADPPSNVTNFHGTQVNDEIRLDWTHIEDADLAGYEIRVGSQWDIGKVIGSKITDDYFYYRPEITGTYGFFICAIDDTGHYSTTPKSCSVTVSNITPTLNIIWENDYVNTPASGTMQNFTWVGPDLVMDGNNEAKVYTMGGSVTEMGLTSSQSSTQKHSGGYSCRLAVGSGSALKYRRTCRPSFPFYCGQTYEVTGWYYIPNAGTGSTHPQAIQIGFNDAYTTGSDYIYSSSSGTVKDAWTLLTHTYTFRTSSTDAGTGLEIRVPNTTAGGDYVYVDDIYVKRIIGDPIPEFTNSFGTGISYFQYKTGAGSGYFETQTIDMVKGGGKMVRILDAIQATEDATDLTFPDRTDMTYPDDNDIHVTTEYYKYPSYLASLATGFTDGTYQPYVGPGAVDGRYFKFREDFRIPSLTARLAMTSFKTVIDVPEIRYKLTNVSIGAGGGTLTFASYGLTFYATPAVGATVTNSAINVVPYIYNKTVTGFSIKLIDIVGAAVSGTVDIEIYGY